MRLYILRALLMKEVHRHIANRGGLALGFLLIVAALLLSVFNPGVGAGGTGGGSLVGGVHRCMIEYDYKEGDPVSGQFVEELIEELRADIPDDLRPHLVIRRLSARRINGLITYPPGTGAIQIRASDGAQAVRFWVWHPPEDPAAMAPYEQWFFKAARDAFHQRAARRLRTAGVDPDRLVAPAPANDDLWAVKDSFHQLDEQSSRLLRGTGATQPLPKVEIVRDGLGAKALDLRSAIATGMVVFALYFACVYLLPTLNCEERERGVLLAQALSPASPAEILTAKFLFYPVLGMVLAATLAGIYKPAVLSTLFFWMALAGMSAGFLGIGMTVATLARTQRAAFMGSMCYLLSVSLILFICSQNGIPFISYLALEYHGPRILHAAITQEVGVEHWVHLAAVAGLATVWVMTAGWLFRKRGWQ